jgi:hypothetical protein
MSVVTASSGTHRQIFRRRNGLTRSAPAPSSASDLLRALTYAGALLDPSGVLATQLFRRMVEDDQRRCRQ